MEEEIIKKLKENLELSIEELNYLYTFNNYYTLSSALKSKNISVPAGRFCRTVRLFGVLKGSYGPDEIV